MRQLLRSYPAKLLLAGPVVQRRHVVRVGLVLQATRTDQHRVVEFDNGLVTERTVVHQHVLHLDLESHFLRAARRGKRDDLRLARHRPALEEHGDLPVRGHVINQPTVTQRQDAVRLHRILHVTGLPRDVDELQLATMRARVREHVPSIRSVRREPRQHVRRDVVDRLVRQDTRHVPRRGRRGANVEAQVLTAPHGREPLVMPCRHRRSILRRLTQVPARGRASRDELPLDLMHRVQVDRRVGVDSRHCPLPSLPIELLHRVRQLVRTHDARQLSGVLDVDAVVFRAHPYRVSADDARLVIHEQAVVVLHTLRHVRQAVH